MKKQLALLLTTAMCVGSLYAPVFAAEAEPVSTETTEDAEKTESPITIETGTNETAIDYRYIMLEDIVITENKIGALEKGKTINFEIDKIEFDKDISFKGMSVKVSNGDAKIEWAKVEDGILKIKIGSESKTEPSTIIISGAKGVLSRSLPAGFYSISLVQGEDDLFFQDSSNPFYLNELVLNERYIEIVSTEGIRDNFEAKISVGVGESGITKNGDEISLEQSAYISEDHVMLPMRAVIEAVSDAAIVRWDDATKTVTLTFGARIISMTVGSKTMNINGVPVEMAKACEIKEGRAFIPLRELGYALGLNGSKINWDEATMTATMTATLN